MRKIIISTLCFLMITLVSCGGSATDDAKDDLTENYKKRYPNDKILDVVESGKPYKRDIVVKNVKMTDFRVPFKVKVKQGKKTKTYSMNVLYICDKDGENCNYKNLSVGESVTEALKGQEPPSKDEVVKLFKETLLKKNTFGKSRFKPVKAPAKITEVNAVQSQFKTYKEKFWYVYKVEADIVDATGKVFVVKIEFVAKKNNMSASWGGSFNGNPYPKVK
ncbi:MAG: hypothetical protein GY714_25160 [Desulfobacterales bacterium]|nr:hypothetical protein [Desulfobacterales bacterium]